MRLRTVILTLLLCLAASTALAAKSAVNTGNFGDVAVKGADVVAYFTQGSFVEGKKEYSLKWSGAEWRFASAEHLRLFRENPEKYAPRYGGYCAYALAEGRVSDIDPEAWAIIDGRLYLHCTLRARATWLQDPQGYIKRADRNWPGALGR